MQPYIQQVGRPATLFRALALSLATIALIAACDEQDRLPTGPPNASPATPQAAIVGANVTSLPFTPVAINESGQVAGTQYGQVSGQSRAVRWSPTGGVEDLGTLGGTASVGYAINEAGQVAGSSFTLDNTGSHAFLWTPGQGMRDLGTLGGSSSTARGINDAGEVVGDSYLASGAQHAFRWTPSQGMRDLGALGGTLDLSQSIAYDINNVGQVIGESFHPLVREMGSHAFLWTAGQGMQSLGSLGGGLNGSIASAINDAGQVVGRSWTALGPFHAFLWTQSQGMRDLGTLLTLNSGANGINEAGQVVGFGDMGPGLSPTAAFLWSAAEGMEGIWPGTGIGLPMDINDRQQVVGSGRVATLQLEPGSRPPVAGVGGPYTGTEGSPVSLALSATDPDGDVFFSKWDLGDGTTGLTDWYFPLPRSHVYQDDGTYTVTLTVRDTKGNSDTKTTTVIIANVAPSIAAGGLTGPAAPIQLIAGSAAAPITLAFSDPAGPNDAYAAEIQCGSGTTLSPTNITSPYAATCTYGSAGIYTLRATVADENGGTSAAAFYRYVVVYDPSGGSTTGSGFYTVPGQGKTKAHFTFNAGFAGHATVPNGTAKFWIPGGQVDFESMAIEMLVISGNRVQLWGTGTLNGEPARFRITAVDGRMAGSDGREDAFRIELWRAGTLVFDTQTGAAQDALVTTEIDGGKIQIHRE